MFDNDEKILKKLVRNFRNLMPKVDHSKPKKNL